jgi:hypothetical protein
MLAAEIFKRLNYQAAQSSRSSHTPNRCVTQVDFLSTNLHGSRRPIRQENDLCWHLL